MVKEYRFMKAKDFEHVCKDFSFYDIWTKKAEYGKAVDRIFLYGAESVGSLKPDDIVKMAQDIKEHSDTDYSVLMICQLLYDLAINTILIEAPNKDDYRYDTNGNEYWKDVDGKRHYTKDEG